MPVLTCDNIAEAIPTLHCPHAINALAEIMYLGEIMLLKHWRRGARNWVRLLECHCSTLRSNEGRAGHTGRSHNLVGRRRNRQSCFNQPDLGLFNGPPCCFVLLVHRLMV